MCREQTFTAQYGVIDEVVMLESSINAVKEALRNGPVAVGMAVPESLSYYSGGVYNDPACGYGADAEIVHAVALVGWGGDEEAGEYWIVRNSWASTWGDSGYFYLSM